VDTLTHDTGFATVVCYNMQLPSSIYDYPQHFLWN